MGLTGIEPVTFAILKHVCEGNVLAAELQARGPTGIWTRSLPAASGAL